MTDRNDDGRAIAAALERTAKFERGIIVSAIALITALAWGYLLAGAGTGMNPWAMTTWQFPPTAARLFGPAEWTPGYALIMFAMWTVMMVAMMLPNALPLLMIYNRIWRQAQCRGQVLSARPPVAALAFGYLAAWIAFSAVATCMQYALECQGLADGMWMWATDKRLTAALLIAAGLYQLSPLKRACLTNCRSPAQYIAGNWRGDRTGAFRLGLGHGLYCLGCCWVLMLLLFAGGVMNLVWIGVLTVLVLLEKLAPFGLHLEKTFSLALIAAGLPIAFWS